MVTPALSRVTEPNRMRHAELIRRSGWCRGAPRPSDARGGCHSRCPPEVVSAQTMLPSRPGAVRSEVDYVWPTTIARPHAPPMVIYLDLNHWTGLAKAASSHPDGKRYRHALEASAPHNGRSCSLSGTFTTGSWRPSPARGRGSMSRQECSNLSRRSATRSDVDTSKGRLNLTFGGQRRSAR